MGGETNNKKPPLSPSLLLHTFPLQSPLLFCFFSARPGKKTALKQSNGARGRRRVLALVPCGGGGGRRGAGCCLLRREGRRERGPRVLFMTSQGGEDETEKEGGRYCYRTKRGRKGRRGQFKSRFLNSIYLLCFFLRTKEGPTFPMERMYKTFPLLQMSIQSVSFKWKCSFLGERSTCFLSFSFGKNMHCDCPHHLPSLPPFLACGGRRGGFARRVPPSPCPPLFSRLSFLSVLPLSSKEEEEEEKASQPPPLPSLLRGGATKKDSSFPSWSSCAVAPSLPPSLPAQRPAK